MMIEPKLAPIRRRGRPSVRPAPAAARLPRFIGADAGFAVRLRRLKVLVVGTGSVGGRVALHLSRLGVRRLWLVDPKSYKAESVLTHETGPSTGFKALSIGRRCQSISRSTRVYVSTNPVQGLPPDVWGTIDVVILATDNLAAEVWVGQRCMYLGVPLIQASLHGESLAAQVRCFGNQDGRGPCPACGFGSQEWALLDGQVRFSCEGGGVASLAPTVQAEPTRSPSYLCSIAADLALNQILRLNGLGEPPCDTVTEYCGYTNQIVTSRLVRRALCRCEHRRFSRATLIGRVADHSLAELAKAARATAGAGPVVCTVQGFAWLEAGLCGCQEPVRIRRFGRSPNQPVGPCRTCGGVIHPSEFFSHTAVSIQLLGGAWSVPLRELGADQARCVLVRQGDAGLLLRGRPTPGRSSSTSQRP